MKCDIFSFAITLWEMMTRKVPTIESVSANSYAILYQMVQGKEGEKEREREGEGEGEGERERERERVHKIIGSLNSCI